MSRAAAVALLWLLWRHTTWPEFAHEVALLALCLVLFWVLGAWDDAPEPWIADAENWER